MKLEPTKVFVPISKLEYREEPKDSPHKYDVVMHSHDVYAYKEIAEAYVLTPEQLEEHSCGFSEWMDIVAIRDGQHEWKYKGDNYAKKYTTKELYQLYLKEQKI